MAGETNAGGFSACEDELAKAVDGKYFIAENYFKDKKLKQFEDAMKSARAGFQSSRGTADAALRAEKEISAIEAQFVKWYEGDEDIDDAPLFTTSISFFRETKAKLSIYFVAMNGLVSGSKEKSMALLSKAFEKFKSAAQKACSLAQGSGERAEDTASTLLRYIDLNHEMRLTGMMAPSGRNEGALASALRQTGGEHMQVSDLRAHAFHSKNAAFQKAAAEALAAFYEYQGALCAAVWFSEQGSG